MSDDTGQTPSITICMAAYNEEAAVAGTLDDCLSTLEAIPGRHTVLVVNDGSTDGTAEILRNYERRYPNLRVVTHPENRGFVAALRTLITEADGDLIFHLAGDGEWKASELPKMLEKLSDGYDIVIGVRTRKHYSLYRAAVSHMYNFLVWLLFGKNFQDIGSIRLVRADLWKRIPAVSSSAFFVAEKLLLAHRNGARIGFVPVEYRRRSGGRSKFNNPLAALRAFSDLFSFWISPRSRQRLELHRKAEPSGRGDIPRDHSSPSVVTPTNK